MSRRRYGPMAAILLCLLGLLGSSPAAAQSSPRAAAHDGFGRMVFDWDAPVQFTTEASGNTLVVRFSRPARGDVRTLVGPLAQYVRDARLSGDGRTVTFLLTQPAQARAFLVGKSVVVDIIPRAAPQPAPTPTPAPTPVPAPARAAPAPAAPRPVEGEPVVVRSGDHTGYHRIVFDWPRGVPYRVDTKDSRATVRFARRARMDTGDLSRSLTPDIALVGVQPEANATTVVLTLPPKARLRHFATGSKVVLDIVRPADSDIPKPPQNQKAPAPVPLAPAPDMVVATPSVPPSKPQPPAPKPPAEQVAEMRAAQEAKAAKETRTAKPDATKPAATKPDAGKLDAGKAESADPALPDSASLPFAFTQPTAAAVFRRAGWLWLVFDRPIDINLTTLATAAGSLAQHIERLPGKDITALRMVTPPGYAPSLRREGLMWIVDLARQKEQPATPLEVQRQDSAAGTALFVPVSEGGANLTLTDPEIGDVMQVIPVVPLGSGIFPGRWVPEAELLATVQGIVVVPRADEVQVRSNRTGVTITAPGGLSVSKVSEGEAANLRLGQSLPSGPLMDVAGWLGEGPQAFKDQRAELEQQLGEMAVEDRNPKRIELARLHLANGNAPEALAILRVVADSDPAIADTPAFRAVRGGAQLLMDRYADAVNDLSTPGLDKAAEANFWRAAAETMLDDPAKAAPLVKAGMALLKDYAPRPKAHVGFLVAESLLAAGDDKAAGELLKVLRDLRLSRMRRGHLAYLDGRLKELGGAFDDALASWQEAQDGDSRLHRALAAVAATELELKLERITPQQASEQLERLRFAWRGDDFEYNLLRRLGGLRLSLGDYGEGLRTYRQLVIAFPDHKQTPDVAKEMRDTFERLFLEGGADTMTPITAIALFDEFRELTPPGEKGDQMIRKLADRLLGVDLLDRAAELLARQVESRLQGVEQARVGAQLAVVQLLNRNPEAALKALQSSEQPDLSEEMATQRRHLYAQTLNDLNRGQEALARLAGDNSGNARLLRAEIQWKRKNWQEAAQAFADLVIHPEPGKPLDFDSARFVLHWATALTLANDDPAVARLRRTYGDLMTTSPYGDAFSLLTADTHSSLADYQQVAAKIKEAEQFQAFMAAYRERLKEQGLSAIN